MDDDNPPPRRRSLRLKEYDYSQPGAYFVTICVQDRRCLFGRIVGEDLRLSPAGGMIEEWWSKLPQKYPQVECGDHVIMPNHVHGVLVLGEAGQPMALTTMVGWFKTMTSNEYIRNVHTQTWAPFERRLWQRGYYEHIVRDEKDLEKIRQYHRRQSHQLGPGRPLFDNVAAIHGMGLS